MVDIEHFRRATRPGQPGWLYKFPNGYKVSVIPDPRPEAVMRFEIETDAPQYANHGGIIPGLTTEDAETVIAYVSELPGGAA